MKALSKRQRGKAEVTIGQGFRATVTLDLTPLGILAVTALVGGILLATREIVATALHEGR